MPIYEYECQKCGTVYEMLRSMSADDKDIVCPECNIGKKAKKLISSFSSSSDSSYNSGSCGSSSGFT